MFCRFCGYDVDVTKMTMTGVCLVCSSIATGLMQRTLTTKALLRILNATRPEEQWRTALMPEVKICVECNEPIIDGHAAGHKFGCTRV